MKWKKKYTAFLKADDGKKTTRIKKGVSILYQSERRREKPERMIETLRAL